MSLNRQTSLSPLTRLMLAVALVCALLITQWRLNDHVVEHSVNTLSMNTSVGATSDSTNHDGPGCLVCLEHQAHGAAPISVVSFVLPDGVSPMLAQALPPNTPYLTPERASQRAPPVLS